MGLCVYVCTFAGRVEIVKLLTITVVVGALDDNQQVARAAAAAAA